jgi:hypothetical protein
VQSNSMNTAMTGSTAADCTQHLAAYRPAHGTDSTEPWGTVLLCVALLMAQTALSHVGLCYCVLPCSWHRQHWAIPPHGTDSTEPCETLTPGLSHRPTFTQLTDCG